MTTYADKAGSTNPEDIVIEEREMTSEDTLEVAMNATGGLAATFIPE